MMLVGTKSDLENEREVLTEEGFSMAKILGISFVEISAKENSNVSECLRVLSGGILK